AISTPSHATRHRSRNAEPKRRDKFSVAEYRPIRRAGIAPIKRRPVGERRRREIGLLTSFRSISRLGHRLILSSRSKESGILNFTVAECLVP
ncbi:unnamed protein product, partial [Musa acuminata subsp. burmannicoides]